MVQAEWLSGREYAVRVAKLSGQAGGLNAGVYLNATTAFDDGAIDVVDGKAGQDWFLVNLGGVWVDSTDAKRDEVRTDV